MRILLYIQGSYFLITGAWPFLHLESFLAVTGDKYDIWLVKMVAALTISVSGLLLIAAYRNKIHIESLFLILGASVSYLLIDVVYAFRDRISNIYLADAAVELLFLVAWAVVLIKNHKQID